MSYRTGRARSSFVLRLLLFVLYAGAAFIITLLLLRFGMRALGVRPDVAFPGFVYGLTAPLVQPFYRSFPAGPRFDEAVVEIASLVAAGAVFAVALGVYVVLLFAKKGDGRATKKR